MEILVDESGLEKTDNEISWHLLRSVPKEPLVELLAHNLGLWQKLGQCSLLVPVREGYLGPLRVWISAATSYPSQGQVVPDPFLIQVKAHVVHKHHCLSLMIYLFFPRSAWPLCQDSGPQGKMLLDRDTDTWSFLQLPFTLFFLMLLTEWLFQCIRKKNTSLIALCFLLTKSRTLPLHQKSVELGRSVCLSIDIADLDTDWSERLPL